MAAKKTRKVAVDWERAPRRIKTIRGRAYEYGVGSTDSPRTPYRVQAEQYMGALQPAQQRIMDRLTVKDHTLLADAWRRGVAIEDIIDWIRSITLTEPAKSTVYAYFKRHGIKREKRKGREAEKAIRLRDMDAYSIHDAWRQGESWQEIQARVFLLTGRKPERSAVYAYFKERYIKHGKRR